MPAGAECVASIIRQVYCAFTRFLREWLGGQDVSGSDLAMAIISTFMLIARMRPRPPQRRQPGYAPGAVPVQEDDPAKEAMHHLETNSNEIAPPWSHARTNGAQFRGRTT